MGRPPDLAAYLDFLEWALGHAPTVKAYYRLATGDTWQPTASSEGREAFLQRFSDWVEGNLYGKPEDLALPQERYGDRFQQRGIVNTRLIDGE